MGKIKRTPGAKRRINKGVLTEEEMMLALKMYQPIPSNKDIGDKKQSDLNSYRYKK